MELNTLLPPIETELQKQVARLDAPRTRPYYQMLTYHMGWSGPGSGPEAAGKRIRPVMLLLACAAAGGAWQSALPAAAAAELVHNFSLIHDDIQDNSEKRRGRPTLWVDHGIAQAINAGDGMFVIAHLAITDLAASHPAETALQAARILHETCLDLTRGQYLDISYETRLDLTEEDYWPMISGKTAALLAGCCQIGALLGGADLPAQRAYRDFGEALGLAFQVQDDLLGIWGDEAVTGKSAASDLLEGKKSLPVLYGLGRDGAFAARWRQGPITPTDVAAVAQLLRDEGAYDYAQNKSVEYTELALRRLAEASPRGEAGQALTGLANQLLNRQA